MNTLEIKLPKRFTDAVSKLYNAFHNGNLNANDCTKCAVGNMCDNDGSWQIMVTGYGEGKLNRDTFSLLVQKAVFKKTGYSGKEIVTIEKLFLKGTGWKPNPKHDNHESKEAQFKGLCAVIEYLCELDNIPNIMEIQSLFETENEAPKKQLQEVFIH